jgi:hypothetical protein
MKRFRFAGIATLALVLFLVASYSFGPAFGQVGKPGGIVNWEYKVSSAGPSESNLNHLGTQGWELCGIVHPIREDTNPHIFIFKRPIR